MIAARSWLFVPGDDPDKLAKAPSRGADALIVDLEDAVPQEGKQEARRMVVEWVDAVDDDTPIWVRVNNEPELLADDVAAARRAGVTGIVVPKVAHAAQAAEVTASVGADHGVIAMIETPAAVLDAAAIAATPGISTLMVGEYDLAAELGIDPSPDRHELAPIRAQVVLACAAAGIAAPIGPVSADFRDVDMFRANTEALRREGHRGRAVIHPAQVGPANDIFTPSADEVAAARRVLDRYEAALAEGKGVGVDDQGRLIDEAIVRSARQTMAAAGTS